LEILPDHASDTNVGRVNLSLSVPAPELDVSEWIGAPSSLESLRGKVVLIEAFQMLCPGCIRYGLPQAQRVQQLFPDVAVVGLHTVFEHHAVTGPDALKVFLSEFGIRFPVGIDRHDARAIPVTMERYQLQGTPSTLVIDRAGRLRLSHFGALDDLALGGVLGRLLGEGEHADAGRTTGSAA
jgi:thiol-disulfide isomerase/thioredoxin